MKIKITSSIGIWIDGEPRPIGYVCTLDDRNIQAFLNKIIDLNRRVQVRAKLKGARFRL